MSDTGEVGAAMWGGRHLVSAPVDEPPAPAAPPRRVIDRDLVSLALVVLSIPALSAGAWLLWGPGGGLLALGVMLLAIGVLLGVGER